MAVPFTVVGIEHVVLRAADPKALEWFYLDAPGLRFERREGKLAQLRAGDALIDIVPADEAGPAGGTSNKGLLSKSLWRDDCDLLPGRGATHAPEPGVGRVPRAEAPSAPKRTSGLGSRKAGKGQPAGLKPLNASRARWFDSPRSSRPRFSTPAAHE
jgi:catechol 2,3-dioxygenase-like lactoylglutathione lyase family enzyme